MKNGTIYWKERRLDVVVPTDGTEGSNEESYVSTCFVVPVYVHDPKFQSFNLISKISGSLETAFMNTYDNFIRLEKISLRWSEKNENKVIVYGIFLGAPKLKVNKDPS